MNWWELWSCQFAHWDMRHLALNLIAAIPPLALAPPHLRRRLPAWALVAAPLLSIVFLISGSSGEYRGASGLVVGLWTLVAVCRRSAIMLTCVAAKLVAEALGLTPQADGFATFCAIHYAGAALGIASGLAWTHTNRFRFV